LDSKIDNVGSGEWNYGLYNINFNYFLLYIKKKITYFCKMEKYLKLIKESIAAYQVYKFLTDEEESRIISDEGLRILNERDNVKGINAFD